MRQEIKFVKCIDHEIPMEIDLPDKVGKYPAILLIHGFMSGKNYDGHMLGKISKALTENNVIAVRIDLCSMGENIYPRTKYGMKVMIEEVKTSFKYLQTLDYIASDRIGLLGHSLGGRLAFTCSTLPAKLVISLNGAINTEEPMNPSYNKLEMKELGYTIMHTSDGRVELLYPKFYSDMKETLNNNIKDFKNPILVCVATNDPTLDPNIGLNFIKNCNMPNVDGITIQDANHTFNAKTGDYTKLNELISKLIPWVNQHI